MQLKNRICATLFNLNLSINPDLLLVLVMFNIFNRKCKHIALNRSKISLSSSIISGSHIATKHCSMALKYSKSKYEEQNQENQFSVTCLKMHMYVV